MTKLFSILLLVTILILSQCGFAPTEALSATVGECVGACCYPNGTCSDDLTQAECQDQGGYYMGDGTDCAHVDCAAAIPTLTEWGLILFGMVLLGFITWVFLKRRKALIRSSSGVSH
jgi:LPXTG-motif cell wall-anchored protein